MCLENKDPNRTAVKDVFYALQNGKAESSVFQGKNKNGVTVSVLVKGNGSVVY